MSDNVQTALVVDDSRLARIALSKLLQKRNIAVDVVGTGTEAMDYLEDQRPDVVFMDYMMPDMDGFEATRRIRALNGGGRMPVVMYTSQDTDEDRDRARQLGIVGFLSKPSGEHNLDDVLARLGRLMGDTVRGVDATSGPATPQAGGNGPDITEPPAWQEDERIEPTLTFEPETPVADERATATGPTATPDSAAHEPATPARHEATPALDLPWPAIRDVARQAADEAVMDAAERAVAASIGPHREELEALARGAREHVEENTRDAARDAAEAASASLADATARAIGERVAEETTRRVIEEVGPETARLVMNDLRREVRNYVSELFAADAFRNQVIELVNEIALPTLRDTLTQELAPQIRQQVLRETLDQTERKAVEAARSESRDAAQQALERHLDDLAEDQTRRTRSLVAEARNRMLIGLSAVGAIAVLALALSVFLR